MKKKQIKVLVAPNSLKGSMSAFEFADVMEAAFLKVSSGFDVRKVPVADGGDFTGEVLRSAFNAVPVEVEVNDPLGRPVLSRYFAAGKTAIIEMADASGIKLLKEDELDPMRASSYGTGQLISAATANGCTQILLGVGGSATVDGGSGMMQALGFRYWDADGNPLNGNGGNLSRIVAIEKNVWPDSADVKIITDVNNPLLGPGGAAAVFGPQKGASPEQVTQLEQGLRSWCSLLEKESGKKLSDLKGAGAAGGIAVPLVALAEAEIVPGADYILSLLNFEEHVRWADVVITGEGKIDMQTQHNKAPWAVADSAGRAGKPVIAIGGAVDPRATNPFTGGAFSFLNHPMALEDAMQNAHAYLEDFSRELAKFLLSFFKK